MTELELNIERHESMIRVLTNGKYKNVKDKADSEARAILLETELNSLKEQQKEIEENQAPIKLNDLDIFENDESHLKVS